MRATGGGGGGVHPPRWAEGLAPQVRVAQGPEEADGGQQGAPHAVAEGSAWAPAVSPEMGASGIRDTGLVVASGAPVAGPGRRSAPTAGLAAVCLSASSVSHIHIKIDGDIHLVSRGGGNKHALALSAPPLLLTGHRSSSPTPARAPSLPLATSRSRKQARWPLSSAFPGFPGQDTLQDRLCLWWAG